MAVAASKIAFDNGGAFILDTRREVEQYLSRGSTRIKGAVLLYLKAPIALALTVISWTVLMFFGPGVFLAPLCLLGLVLGAMLTAFCVQHDANHGSYFKKRRWNHLVGWSTDSLLGFSSYAWRVKHNVATTPTRTSTGSTTTPPRSRSPSLPRRSPPGPGTASSSTTSGRCTR